MSLYCFNAENVSKEIEISEVEECFFFLICLFVHFLNIMEVGNRGNGREVSMG